MGLRRLLTVESKPLDIEIKGEGEAWPQPAVSHQSPVQFIKAYYQTDSAGQDSIFLRFHRDPKFGPVDESHWLSLLSYSVFDGRGKKLDLCDNGGSGGKYFPAGFGMVSRALLRDNFPESDFMILILQGQSACGGWAKYKGPFSIEAEFSADECWPIKIKVPVTSIKSIDYDDRPFR